MARTTLAERMNRLEQQKAKLAEEEARLRDQERKARTRRLIEAGGLIDKAGLLDLDANTLLGALLSVRAETNKPQTLARWAAEGGMVFAQDAAMHERAREPLTVVFPAPVARDLTAQLRASGLRWNRVLLHWEGLAEHDVIAPLVSGHSGTIKRVREPDMPLAVAAE